MLNSAINGREAAITGVAWGEGRGEVVLVLIVLGGGVVGVGVERGSLVVHFDWSAEFCVERRGRDRLLEAYPRGSVRALQQKHLDGAGNICLRKRMDLNKQATREEGDAQRLGRLVCTHQSGGSRSGRFYCIQSVVKNQNNHLAEGKTASKAEMQQRF